MSSLFVMHVLQSNGLQSDRRDSRMNIKTRIAAYAFIVMSTAAQGPVSKAASTKPSADAIQGVWSRCRSTGHRLDAIACTGPETCWLMGTSPQSSSRQMAGRNGRCSLAAIRGDR
jgi:hypothetical protein